MRLCGVVKVSLTMLLRSDEPSLVARSATVRLDLNPRETLLREVECHCSAIGPVSVSRYTARLRAIGADLGTGH